MKQWWWGYIGVLECQQLDQWYQEKWWQFVLCEGCYVAMVEMENGWCLVYVELWVEGELKVLLLFSESLSGFEEIGVCQQLEQHI